MALEIMVYRNDNGEPTFRYPKEWDAEKTFEQICELCCQLQEKVNMQSETIRALRHKIDH